MTHDNDADDDAEVAAKRPTNDDDDDDDIGEARRVDGVNNREARPLFVSRLPQTDARLESVRNGQVDRCRWP